MNKVSFCEIFIVYNTYSSEEYDRSNYDLPSLAIKLNANDFGGKYRLELVNIYNELNFFKKTEMKDAFETSKLYTRKSLVTFN